MEFKLQAFGVGADPKHYMLCHKGTFFIPDNANHHFQPRYMENYLLVRMFLCQILNSNFRGNFPFEVSL